MKYYMFILLMALLQFNCTEENYPSCELEIGSIEYPFIAHSHNDYEQDLPISHALDHGFASLEVDVAYDGEKLRISHDEKDLSEKLEFEQSYLLPILNREIGESGLILLVDLKNYSSNLINHLNSILSKYNDRLVSREDTNASNSRVKIILSGEYPRQEILNDIDNEFLFIDGRLNATDLNSSSDIVPIISLNIDDVSNSNAKNEEEIQKVINRVHDTDKLIRFWNTNDKESVWLTLIDLDVDIIGVDDIEKFCGIMKKNDIIK